MIFFTNEIHGTISLKYSPRITQFQAFVELCILYFNTTSCFLVFFKSIRWSLFLSSSLCLSVCLRSIFGISPIVQSNCSYTWKLIVHPERKWNHFVNPIILLMLYYTLATLIRLWLQEPIDQLTVRTACGEAMQLTAHPSSCAVNCTQFTPPVGLYSLIGEMKRNMKYNTKFNKE